jgi:hypothetical protein
MGVAFLNASRGAFSSNAVCSLRTRRCTPMSRIISANPLKNWLKPPAFRCRWGSFHSKLRSLVLARGQAIYVFEERQSRDRTVRLRKGCDLQAGNVDTLPFRVRDFISCIKSVSRVLDTAVYFRSNKLYCTRSMRISKELNLGSLSNPDVMVTWPVS